MSSAGTENAASHGPGFVDAADGGADRAGADTLSADDVAVEDVEPADAELESYDINEPGDDRPGLEDVDDLDVLESSGTSEDDDIDDDSDEDDESDSDDDDADEDDSDDEDSDDSDDSDDEDYDDLEDAEDEEIDLAVALYREDGQGMAVALPNDVANDLDEFIVQLRRVPGDVGALGMVSIGEEFVVLVRVRGRAVQVLLSDAVAATEWPIARDVVDFLMVDAPDEDDDPAPLGDLAICADMGISELDMEAIITAYDDPSDEVAMRIAEKLKLATPFRRALESGTRR